MRDPRQIYTYCDLDMAEVTTDLPGMLNKLRWSAPWPSEGKTLCNTIWHTWEVTEQW